MTQIGVIFHDILITYIFENRRSVKMTTNIARKFEKKEAIQIGAFLILFQIKKLHNQKFFS
jgi:hypothetical protein